MNTDRRFGIALDEADLVFARRVAPRPVDYRRLLGDIAWMRLPQSLRSRFERMHLKEVTYFGEMQRIELNRAGRLLATICRLVGEPLVAAQGCNVPTHVRVFTDSAGGTVWERAYHFAGRPTRTVCSAKRLGADGSLLECLGFGLHMKLNVSECNGELHFNSNGYFLHILGIHLALPRRWFPGETKVIHRDEGNGQFRFVLDIHHPLFGAMVHQDGVFHEQKD